MINRAVEAKNKFGKMMCAAAVLTTYKDEAGISEEKALEIGPPMSGGRMGTCGAVLAAEEVLKRRGLDTPEMLAKLRGAFEQKNGSTECRVLKGRTGGPVLRSCPGCIEDASNILESILADK